MMKLLAALSISLAFISSASAHGRQHHYHHHKVYRVHSMAQGLAIGLIHMLNSANARSRGLPWCGAFMADRKGYSGAEARKLWIAREWAREGAPTVPHEGAVVVWAHHVGELVSQVSGDVWVVLSGNDGNAVRERPMSIANAIAIRDVGGASYGYAPMPERTHYASNVRQQHSVQNDWAPWPRVDVY